MIVMTKFNSLDSSGIHFQETIASKEIGSLAFISYKRLNGGGKWITIIRLVLVLTPFRQLLATLRIA